MKRLFTAWSSKDGVISTLVEGEARPCFADGTPDPTAEILLWTVEVGSIEEATAIRNLRNGWEAFQPEGEAEPCPQCGALYYPMGSGQCWRCEHKCGACAD
jgi:hypothetical protein